MSNVSKTTRIASAALGAGLMLTLVSETVSATGNGCNALPSQADLKTALDAAVSTPSGTLNNNMWATIVNADDIVCAVAFSGSSRRGAWLLSRAISAQKAGAANGLSLAEGAKANGTNIAISTANLFTSVNPGGNFFGLQFSNPVDPEAAYQGRPGSFGTANDPMVGEKIGGVNVFGGGLALYKAAGARDGGVGVSGGSACEDHVVAWRVRDTLGLDNIPGGVAAGTDNIIFDLQSIEGNPGVIPPAPSFAQNTGGFFSPSGFGHPTCGGDADGPGDGDAESLGQALPVTNPIGP